MINACPQVRARFLIGVRTVMVVLLICLGVWTQAADRQAAQGGSVQALLANVLAEWEDPLERQAIMRELAAVFTEDMREVQQLLADEPAEAREVLEEVVDEAADLVELKEEEPAEYERVVALHKAENTALAMARKMREGTDAERERLMPQFKQRLTEYFALRQQGLQAEIAHLERELAHLKSAAAKRAKYRDRLIERKAWDMLHGEELEW